MTEPEAELQASANLSPVSPSPVHTAAPLVVPALQDTVDTIDAMVAAAAGALDGHVDTPVVEPVVDPALADAIDNDDVVDDDSFNDAYGEDAEPGQPPQAQAQPEPSENNDDYAKTFDSPIEPEQEVDLDNEPHVQSTDAPESNPLPIPSEQLNISHSSEVTPAAAHDPSATSSTSPASNDIQNAQPETSSDPTMPTAADVSEGNAQNEDQGAQSVHTNGSNPAVTDTQSSSSLDIQKLVADLTAQPTESNAGNDPPSASPAQAQAEPPSGSASLSSSTALPTTSSLPPRPPQPHSASPLYASQHHPAGANSSATANPGAQSSTGSASSYHIGSAPGTSAESVANLPPPPSSALNVPPYATQAAHGYSADQGRDVEYQRKWDQFMADERQYMSEAKWDRFPEGSRIFIGNLSSDKVSKRDVFDLFHRYGRLAQISLKSAYGFVQYHTIEEGQRAMDNLQGIEIKGRRIHLEISRVQDKSKKERNRSPDRTRGRENGRRGDKHSRDDYRPGRNHSPRRNDYHARDDSFGGRDRGYSDSGRGGRGRSRSPDYGRNDRDPYRRRSPSPHGRPRNEPELDIPRRYGADVPDVQMILQPDVNRDFVNWVEGAFKAKGLKTQVMYLHPRFPKDQVIQRQAAEGVHGVVDLDLRAQNLARIPVQVFDRSAGNNNVRFDQYVDLDPGTAAEVILRAKSSAAPATYSQGYAGGNGAYQNPYGAQPQQPSYNGSQPSAAYHTQPQQQQPPPTSAGDIASLIGQVDNATLQRLLSTIQTPGATPLGGGYPHTAAGAVHTNPNPQVDIQAILGSLGGANAQQHAPPQPPYGGPYGGQPPSGGGGQGAAGNNGDAANQVQNIMAQLARYRQ